MGQWYILILQELTVKFALVFDLVSQLFVFSEFHVRSYSMNMLEINEILELIIPNLVTITSFWY